MDGCISVCMYADDKLGVQGGPIYKKKKMKFTCILHFISECVLIVDLN